MCDFLTSSKSMIVQHWVCVTRLEGILCRDFGSHPNDQCEASGSDGEWRNRNAQVDIPLPPLCSESDSETGFQRTDFPTQVIDITVTPSAFAVRCEDSPAPEGEWIAWIPTRSNIASAESDCVRVTITTARTRPGEGKQIPNRHDRRLRRSEVQNSWGLEEISDW